MGIKILGIEILTKRELERQEIGLKNLQILNEYKLKHQFDGLFELTINEMRDKYKLPPYKE